MKTGPNTACGAKALDWMRQESDQHGSDARFLVPCQVHIGALGITGAFLLAPKGPSGLVRLDDTALGIGLRERIAGLFDYSETKANLWLEVTWGPLVERPGMGGQKIPVLAVRKVLGIAETVEELFVSRVGTDF